MGGGFPKERWVNRRFRRLERGRTRDTPSQDVLAPAAKEAEARRLADAEGGASRTEEQSGRSTAEGAEERHDQRSDQEQEEELRQRVTRQPNGQPLRFSSPSTGPGAAAPPEASTRSAARGTSRAS